MYSYIYYFIFITSLYFIYKIQLFLILKQKYKKWNNLNSLVSTRKTNNFDIYWYSVKIICRMLYLSFIQYLNTSVVKITKGRYIISYVVNGKMYKMVVKPLRGPSPILQIINDNMEDVTEDIIPYLGPDNDFHKINYNPVFFNYDYLTFEMSNGNQINFSKNDVLKIV
jgi:hypothetical protein